MISPASSAASLRARAYSASSDGPRRIAVGLVNNMGDAALQATERQFRDLLSAASLGYDVHLRLFSFPELIRGEAARAYIRDHYEPIEHLWSDTFDALIVTGAEPRTAALSDEAYWPSLIQLIDVAEESGTSTVWSCLAAHAAVLHLDGVPRRRLERKLSGIYACTRRTSHPLLAGMPSSWRLPHSRLNTLDAALLEAAGYEILSASETAGPDVFLRARNATFLFLQGHPEYDANTLFLEYRRDVGRFLTGVMDEYPEIPAGCFDTESASVLDAFRRYASRHRTPSLLEQFPKGHEIKPVEHVWRDAARRLYQNLFRLVAVHKT